ncbi:MULTISPECIES: ABC transporter permease [Nocardiopsidaceae]|uniref:ABC-2 type transport system permease protein n=1 Tax=Streptomonospora salina TaxID=104205 RepID=A0A841E5Q0_9ACTN|nr:MULTISPECIES: ABC transporter permease [Nocardiopsaceae]MBB5999217.1 ABC-2 type transport system permease protein [Streptomonospora salina]
MTTQQTADAAPAGTAGARQRRPVSPLRQTLRLTRTEFTLMYRYRTALFFVLFPLVFVFLGVVSQGESPVPGVSNETLALTGSPAAIIMMIGVMHVSNTYAARREQLILKRFRASGVPPVALFGATTLSVLAVVVLLTAVPWGVLIAQTGEVPADPVMVALAVVLSTVTMVLLGAALTRLARNAEGTQMMSIVPFLALYASSGLMIPLEMMPDQLATASRLLPMAPVVELLRGGYTGNDVFGDLVGASPATGLDLWAAALPSLAVVLAWTALSVLSLRYFRWDPRQPG